MSQFIGENKIKGTEKLEDDYVMVSFKSDHPPVKIKESLLKIISTEEKNKGGVIDVIRHYLSTKYLKELSDYGLEFYMIDHIGQGMKTLAHNLREELFSKAFDCQGANDIKLSKLLEDYEKEE